MNTTPTPDMNDKLLEEEAKLEWEAFQPEIGTIEWYDRFYAEIQDIGTAKSNPHYHRSLLTILAGYKVEREEHGNDETWLMQLREQYMDEQADFAEWEKEDLEKKLGKSGHTIANVLAGDTR